MADLIDRQAVLNLIEQSCCDLEYDCDNVALRKEVEALPTAQQWIPCSERLPDKNGYYLATCERFGRNAEKEVITDFVELYRGIWIEPGDVIAWMPLPEPWKGET